MVKLRLRRKGRIHHPVYDIVAVDSRSRRDGAFIERLGYYDPNTLPSTISIDPDRAIYWLDTGAQPTETVRLLLSYDGILLRRYLALKGKNQVEIEEEVQKHKETTKNRYFRRKELRSQRRITRAKEKEAAEKEAANATAE